MPVQTTLPAPAELTSVGAEALVDAEIRDVLRRGGIDPAADQDAVRAVIADAVAGYERQRLRARLPGLGDIEALSRRLFDGVAGLGPLQKYLDDPEVEEIWVVSGLDLVCAGQRAASTAPGTSGAHQASSIARRVRSSVSGSRWP